MEWDTGTPACYMPLANGRDWRRKLEANVERARETGMKRIRFVLLWVLPLALLGWSLYARPRLLTVMLVLAGGAIIEFELARLRGRPGRTE
jgi:hypothetical protein